MSLRGFLLIAVLLLGAVPALADCECPAGSLEQAIRKAETIIRGEIVSARLLGATVIEFDVQVNDAVRGNPESEYRLTTPMPGACGVAVRLGFNDLFVLDDAKHSVSTCNGSGRANSKKYVFLSTAIRLVDLPVSDARGAERLISQRFNPGFGRAEIDAFFEFVEKIDPLSSSALHSDSKIEYRGIALRFVDGRFDNVEIR